MKRKQLNLTDPPSILGKTGAELWCAIQDEREIVDTGGLETLRQLCLAADRVAQCAAAIKRDGSMIKTKSGELRDNPLLRHELASRAFIIRALSRLGRIATETKQRVGRPGYGGIGISYEDLHRNGR